MSRVTKLRPLLSTSHQTRNLISSSVRRRLASTHALVFLEHSNGAVESASLSALTAATQLGEGNKVTGIIVGSKEEVDKVLPNVQK